MTQRRVQMTLTQMANRSPAVRWAGLEACLHAWHSDNYPLLSSFVLVSILLYVRQTGPWGIPNPSDRPQSKIMGKILKRLSDESMIMWTNLSNYHAQQVISIIRFHHRFHSYCTTRIPCAFNAQKKEDTR